jgi:hypothetical protein
MDRPLQSSRHSWTFGCTHRAPDSTSSMRRECCMHDVFHFPVLKPYHEPTHPDQQEIMIAPVAPEDPSDPSRGEFEVSHIASHDTIPHATTQIPSLHFFVHWLGYDSNEATWLPVDALPSCLHKVADYLFTIATARTRLQLIAQFPRSLRDTLLDLLHRTKNTVPLPRPPCRPRAPNSIPCAKRKARPNPRPPALRSKGPPQRPRTRSQALPAAVSLASSSNVGPVCRFPCVPIHLAPAATSTRSEFAITG